MVADERIIAFDLRTRLTRMGHTVVGAVASGPEAMAQVEALRRNLVLMDIRLQGPMDGIEAAAVIHTHLDLPVIYLSASVDAMTLARPTPPALQVFSTNRSAIRTSSIRWRGR
jgi:CheY-like chemotaxis protein